MKKSDSLALKPYAWIGVVMNEIRFSVIDKIDVIWFIIFRLI